MLKIRLQRVGRKNDPSFRMVVTESTNAAKKSGRFAEILGSYDARKGEPTVKADRVNHWISVGAKPSVTAHNLLVKMGVIKDKTKNPLPKKTVIKKPASTDTSQGGDEPAPAEAPLPPVEDTAKVEVEAPAEVAEETPVEAA